MIVINGCFSRKVRRGGRTQFEHKNVTGIEMDLDWEDQQAIRVRLMKHKPLGDGWSIQGYALVGPAEALKKLKQKAKKYIDPRGLLEDKNEGS